MRRTPRCWARSIPARPPRRAPRPPDGRGQRPPRRPSPEGPHSLASVYSRPQPGSAPERRSSSSRSSRPFFDSRSSSVSTLTRIGIGRRRRARRLMLLLLRTPRDLTQRLRVREGAQAQQQAEEHEPSHEASIRKVLTTLLVTSGPGTGAHPHRGPGAGGCGSSYTQEPAGKTVLLRRGETEHVVRSRLLVFCRPPLCGRSATRPPRGLATSLNGLSHSVHRSLFPHRCRLRARLGSSRVHPWT